MILAFWSTYIPVGALIMLLAGPSIMGDDWRWLWMANGAAATINALSLFFVRPVKEVYHVVRPRLQDVRSVVLSAAPPILATSFAVYAIYYFALTTFLPTIVVDRLGLSLAAAGLVSAAALAVNAIGNVCAGLLLQRGTPIALILSAVFATVALCGIVIFSPWMPGFVIVVTACISLGLTGLLPSTVISSMPRFVEGPQRLAIGMGLVQQASSVGQIVGPVAVALCVDWMGWHGVMYLFLIIAACGLFLAFMLPPLDRSCYQSTS